MKEIQAFGIKAHPLLKSEFLSVIERNLMTGFVTIQNGINASSINLSAIHNGYRSAINNSTLINIDGISVVWAFRFLGYKVPQRVACPDLALDILELSQRKNLRVFLLGADDSNLSSCINNLNISYPNLIIAGFHNGYFNIDQEEEVIKKINESESDILLLGMPSPKKELFIENNRNLLKVKYILGVGGLFDILSGSKKRAPLWVQRIGMEWLYRFIQDPRHMWRRYLVGNVLFIWLVIKEKIFSPGNK